MTVEFANGQIFSGTATNATLIISGFWPEVAALKEGRLRFESARELWSLDAEGLSLILTVAGDA